MGGWSLSWLHVCGGAPRWVARSLWFWCQGCIAGVGVGACFPCFACAGSWTRNPWLPIPVNELPEPLSPSSRSSIKCLQLLFSSTSLCYSLSHGHSIREDTGERFPFMMQNESSVYRTNCLDAVCLWLHELVHAKGLRQLGGRSYHWEK